MPPIAFPRILFTLLSLVLVTCATDTHSQQDQSVFETLSVDQGMPTIVHCILQDRIGYMWIGTENGLYRYDGYAFFPYKHDIDDPSSIINNTVIALYQDKAGILWVGTHFGLEQFDYVTGTFVHHTPSPIHTGADASNSVGAIREDRNGALWLGTDNGLYRFNRTTGEFAAFRHDNKDAGSLSHDDVNVIHEDEEGSLWFGTGAGLDKLDFDTGRFIHYRNAPANGVASWDNGSEYWIQSMCGDDCGTLWLGTNGGLVEFKPNGGTSSLYRPDPNGYGNRINSLTWDPLSCTLWLATWDALFAFDGKSRTFSRYNQKANAVLSERSGTLWIGTTTDIKKLNWTKPPFRKYSMDTPAYAVCSGAGEILWIFTASGWLKFDATKGQFIPYAFRRGSLFYVWNGESDLSIRTSDGGLCIQDAQGNITISLDSSWKDYVNSLSFGWKGTSGYWFGRGSGELDLFEPHSKHVHRIRNVGKSIYWIYEDSYRLVWIATQTGSLFCYDYGKDSLTEFVSNTRYSTSMSGNKINTIFEDSKRRLWFGTTAGLNRLERTSDTLVHFTERDGLPSNNILGILEDDHGSLWLNTSKGISKFDPDTHRCKNYDPSYGLELAADLFLGVGCKTGHGEMFFPGAKGITRFHPDSIKDNPFIPPVVITSFRTFDKPCPLSPDIHLAHDQNSISFEFVALSYVCPERNQYAYKMEGLDKDWVYSGTRRHASYPRLEPGEYVFRVKGSNNDEVWNEAGTSIGVVILPPWWKTTWAYALSSLLLLSTAWLVWKMQMKRLRTIHEYEMSRFEASKLHEVDELKSRFFANISHEFRTPLTLIIGPVKRMRDASKDPQTQEELGLVHKNASRLLELVNQLLDLSRLESGNMKLQASPEDVIPLLKGLLQSFCSYAERKKISMAFTSSAESLIVHIDKDKFQKIITNILGNAFKFTPEGGQIEVSVAHDSRHVNIRISDSGIGIPAAKIPKIFDRFYQVDGSHTREQEGTGIGLSLTRELVELHKGVIAVESEEGRGSTFTVRLPLGRAHLLPEEICDSGDAGRAEREKTLAHPTAIRPPEEPRADGVKIIPSTDKGKPVLLIVEDNADVRQYIRRDLEAEYNVIEAIDGADGWNRSLEQMPDVIISDVMMPRMDGFALCDRLKTDERTSHIPVILLTAKATSQDKIEGFQTGADDYIMKPFELEELRARLRNLLQQRTRLHEHFRKHGLLEIEEQRITPVDQDFLQKLLANITEQMSDPAFGVEMLAEQMAVSRSLLLKKLEALTGEAPVDLIKQARLNKAAKLIEAQYGNTFQVALEVGFSSPSYFTKCFKRQFGVNPSEYLRTVRKSQS